MKALIHQLGKKRDALAGTWRKRTNRKLVARRFAIHLQTDTDVARFFLAEIRDLHFETQRLLDWRQPTGQPKIAHRKIVVFMLARKNHVGCDLAFDPLQRALNFGKLPPACRLAVGYQVNLFP